ncbi:hypothetical protein DEM27_08310 [Metarhizobium album]|uniref:Uncharacterized protein n=1 Tax=Metarhizobium album TaxID=2182425 RepID=A0A2U2DSX9_9HYPH|nr:hypothetical protein [Rhizobium album]PWE56391.1 hypothetical protein DEM27_08310 [Rhizobium album]
MSKARRLAHERRKETWNIWRIKSPWLRLPAAWLLVWIYAAVVFGLVVGAAVVGACVGARVGAREYVAYAVRAVDVRQILSAMTKWRVA